MGDPGDRPESTAAGYQKNSGQRNNCVAELMAKNDGRRNS
jgi:hypothetical protein